MSEIPHAHPVKDATCEVMFRGRLFEAPCSRHCIDLRIPSGGARRDRTDDLMLAKHALSQLSYGPVPEDECFTRSPSLALRRSSLRSRKACRAEAAEQRRLVGLGRLELPTSRLSSARSNQLSYKPLTTNFLKKDLSVARAQPASRRMVSTSASPWRVFVREERETKTAKSRQWSSTILKLLAPDVSKTIR